MRQREGDLEALSAQVAVVTFQGGFLVDAYVRETKLRWPILLDESLELYRSYGMERGRWQDIWGPATWWTYLKLLLRGRRLQRSSADVNQLGGDVLIDPDSIVRLHHVGRGPADRPAVDSLLDVVRQHNTIEPEPAWTRLGMRSGKDVPASAD